MRLNKKNYYCICLIEDQFAVHTHTQMYATQYLDVSDIKNLTWNSGQMCNPFTVKSSSH